MINYHLTFKCLSAYTIMWNYYAKTALAMVSAADTALVKQKEQNIGTIDLY